MAIGLSPQAEAQAAQIPNISERLERFIAEQYALEQWRAGRRDPEIQSIIAEATGIAAGSGDAESTRPENRDAMFSRLVELIEGISNGHAN